MYNLYIYIYYLSIISNDYIKLYFSCHHPNEFSMSSNSLSINCVFMLCYAL